jgi:isocitrate lyase
MTYPEAGVAAINRTLSGAKRDEALKVWNSKVLDCGLEEARALAKSLGFEFYFDWDALRTPEGFYLLKGSIEYCARRGREYLKYCDLMWMETPTPDLETPTKLTNLVK